MMPDDVIYDHDDAKFYFLHKYTLFFPSLTSSTSYESHTIQKDKGIKNYGITGGGALKSLNLKAVTGTTMFPPDFCGEGKSGGIFCVTFLCLAGFCYCVQPGYTFLIPVIVSYFPLSYLEPSEESIVSPVACLS